jgi:hypothetical protein
VTLVSPHRLTLHIKMPCRARGRGLADPLEDFCLAELSELDLMCGVRRVTDRSLTGRNYEHDWKKRFMPLWQRKEV